MGKYTKSTDNLIKAIILFAVYFIYTSAITPILGLVGITSDVAVMFISDLLFLIGIVYLYKDTLKNDLNNFIKNYNLKEKIFHTLSWVFILFLVNMIGGMVTELVAPTLTSDDGNTEALYSLASISTFYTIFKTMIFGVIAEELLFKKTIRDVIPDNDFLFILASGLIYSLINIAYTEMSLETEVAFISYFIFSSVLSYVYIKKDNLIAMMLIKFVYNLIPLTILLVGIGIGA